MSTELERRLIERIERDGPITFRDFMHAALYDAALGYYNTERAKIGPAGDYYTSSNVHPAFGAVLARTFVELCSQPTSTAWWKKRLRKWVSDLWLPITSRVRALRLKP